MKEPQIPIAKEGYPFILFAFFVTVVLAFLGYDILTLVSLVIAAFVLNFFRDPERIVPEDQDAIVSPADGKVIIIDKVFDDRFINEQAYKVSIFMNIFNVHVNRVPFPGKVSRIQYSAGKFYSADSDKAALENEYCAVVLTTDANKKMAFVQMAGLIARRIVCWAEKDDTLKRGQRFGLIRFGSRVDLYLPLDTQLEVTVGQKIVAGESIIGYLPGA